MSDLDDFKATYFDECNELLSDLEEQFVAIEEGDHSTDRLHAAFRAIHSIKGGAGAFGFTGLVNFAHEFETLLDFMRNDKVEMSDDVVALCIRANDIVADYVEAARTGAELDPGYGAQEKERFVALCSGHAGPGEGEEDGEPMEEFDIDFTPVAVDLEHKAEPAANGEGGWLIRFTPHRELYARANDPLLLLRELAELGEITVDAVIDRMPVLAEFEPFGVYCSWAITLKGEGVTEEAIREVFEFVEGDCDIEISYHEAAAAPAGEQAGADEGDMPSLADLVSEMKAQAPAEPKAQQAAAFAPAAPSGGGDAANDKNAPASTGVQSIRVDLEKVDRVVNMVGELVITQSMLTQQMDDNLKTHYQEMVRGLEVLAQTTRGLQDSVMAIRAQPVKSVFSRMPRMVRELAGKTGKKIRLEMVGENTEIDKTVIEQLADPLTHMIRNSADHGVETPEKRREAGKGETGVIRLSAEQAGGNILIMVEDDGAGINRERVLDKARERGVVAPDQQLTEEQIDNLVFAPGFSTADEVSDISGRGVGMDVVMSNIKKIGGSVHVRSWPGAGTRMTLRLPLTLAVLDVMLVSVGQCSYVIPLSSIVETMQCARAGFGTMPTGGRVMQVRGEYVQVVDLSSRFQLPTRLEEKDRFVVLCEAEGSVKVALVVDDIIGQQQVVIKSLEENFERIDGIAGGTILGDGNVALIVDVQGLRSTSGHRNAA